MPISKLSEILEDEDFLSASPDVQANIRQSYFDQVVSTDGDFQSADEATQASIRGQVIGAEPEESFLSQAGQFADDTVGGAVDAGINAFQDPQQSLQSLGEFAQPGLEFLEPVLPVLEKLRTPLVGLGGLLKFAQTSVNGEGIAEAAQAASDSVQQRRGLGAEVIDPFVRDGSMTESVAGFVADVMYDPLNFIGVGQLKGMAEGAKAFISKGAKSEDVVEAIATVRSMASAHDAKRATMLRSIADDSEKMGKLTGKIKLSVDERVARTAELRSKIKGLKAEKNSQVRGILEEAKRLKKEGAFSEANRLEKNIALKTGKNLQRQIDATSNELKKILSGENVGREFAEVQDEIVSLESRIARSSSELAELSKSSRSTITENIPQVSPRELSISKPNPLATGAKAGDALIESAESLAKNKGTIENLSSPEMLNKFNEGASGKEIVEAIKQDPNFAARFETQKGGVVPRKDSIDAGQRLEATLEEFSGLKPREGLGRGTLDAQTAAAELAQRQAASNLTDLHSRLASGDSLEAMQGEIAQNLEAIIGAQGIKSEAGRALGVLGAKKSMFERAQARLVKEAIKERVMEDPVRTRKFLEQMSNLKTDKVGQRLMATKKFFGPDNPALAMLREYRPAALLTSPITYLRNFIGNRAALVSRSVENIIASGLDETAAKMFGGVPERTMGEISGDISGAMGGVKAAVKDAWEVLIDESSTKGFGSEFAIKQGAIPGPIGKAIRFPFRVLNADDTFQRSVIANAEMHRLAHRTAITEGLEGTAKSRRIAQIIEKPSDEIVEASMKTAQEYAFQEELTGTLGKFNGAINSEDSLGAVLKFVVPFFKTPANIGRFVARRTPIISELTQNGVVRNVVAKLTGNAGRGDVADAVARNVVGAGMLTTFYMATSAYEGHITGAGPSNFKQKKILMEQGWKPFSIKVGDRYFSYRGFEPLSGYLSAVAGYVEEARENPRSSTPEKVSKIAFSAIKNFINQPFLQGLKEIMEALEKPERSFGGLVTRQAASLIPTAVRQAALASADVRKHPKGFMETIMTRVPGMEANVRPRLSRLGQPIPITSTILGLVDKPEVMNPVIEDELLALDAPFHIGFMSESISGRKLDPDEYNLLVSVSGQAIIPALEGMIDSASYKELTSSEKLDEIKFVVNRARRDVREAFRPRLELRSLGLSSDLTQEELGFVDDAIMTDGYDDIETDAEKKKILSKILKRYNSEVLGNDQETK